ncbi:Endoplasmic reticulum metallopeptidase 1 [Strongyloides ratti]|uniref:FXNA-like protease n=1 Tax=Strongyloides ratti TaxID=34506 RepID=A0A090LDY9_STRRB|nr:Endoplasmic reticulum metallopeptidase 1 [Strongyloides ratti]CEF66358.1 Endoplasmic reticulum metallopeptidase 1 [Strongyloides ratti]
METNYLLRKRRLSPIKERNPPSILDDYVDKSRTHIFEYNISFTNWIFFLSLFICIVWISFHLHTKLPTPKDPIDFVDSFSETRISNFLQELSDIGNKPAGSINCELKTFNLIKNKLNQLKEKALFTQHSIEIETQYESSCFNMPRFDTDGFGICYKNISNIIARLSPVHTGISPSRTSLLINCHYDSWPTSDGGSDDLVQCALMIELLDVLTSTRSRPYPIDIIFLFNGAEESSLLASHAFITKHPWRHSVRAFINLEASGSGGRELLFQAGPGNQWILQAYLNSAIHPHCSVLGQEIFQSGVYPGDTDFRIFRDYGRIPGLDIAYVQNGYWWHTEFDQAKRITPGSLQRAGENVLATVKELINSPYFNNPAQYEDKKFVFFDILGITTIVYSMNTAYYLNWTLIIISLIMAAKDLIPLKNLSNNSSKIQKYSSQFLTLIFLHFISFLSMILFIFLSTKVIQFLNLKMLWYSNHIYSGVFYVIPSFCGILSIYTIFVRSDTNIITFQNSVIYFQSLLLLILTILEIASGFLITILLIFNLINKFLQIFYKSLKKKKTKGKRNVDGFIITIFTAPIASLMIIYTLIMVLSIFIPIMGRSSDNSEIIIGLFIGISVYFSSLNFIHLFSKTNTNTKCGMITTLIFIWFGMLFLLKLNSQIGSYHYSDDFPTVRRTQLYHVHRQYFEKNSDIPINSSQLYVIAQDNRGVMDIPFVKNPVLLPTSNNLLIDVKFNNINCENKGKYCELPYYYPTANRISDNHIRVAELHENKFNIETSIKLNDLNIYNNTYIYKFNIKGSGQMSVVMSPIHTEDCIINGWTIVGNDKITSKSSYAFLTCNGIKCGDWELIIKLSCGLYDENMTDITSDEEILKEIKNRSNLYNNNNSIKRLKVTVTSHYLYGDKMTSSVINDIRKEIKKRRQLSPNGPWAMTASSWHAEVVTKIF